MVECGIYLTVIRHTFISQSTKRQWWAWIVVPEFHFDKKRTNDESWSIAVKVKKIIANFRYFRIILFIYNASQTFFGISQENSI